MQSYYHIYLTSNICVGGTALGNGGFLSGQSALACPTQLCQALCSTSTIKGLLPSLLFSRPLSSLFSPIPCYLLIGLQTPDREVFFSPWHLCKCCTARIFPSISMARTDDSAAQRPSAFPMDLLVLSRSLSLAWC